MPPQLIDYFVRIVIEINKVVRLDFRGRWSDRISKGASKQSDMSKGVKIALRVTFKHFKPRERVLKTSYQTKKSAGSLKKKREMDSQQNGEPERTTFGGSGQTNPGMSKNYGKSPEEPDVCLIL